MRERGNLKRGTVGLCGSVLWGWAHGIPEVVDGSFLGVRRMAQHNNFSNWAGRNLFARLTGISSNTD